MDKIIIQNGLNVFILIIYAINSSLLFLHQIESGYEKEWELYNLKVKLTGFLLLNFFMAIILFLGIYLIIINQIVGFFISIVSGVGGLVPLFVHKIFGFKKGHFDEIISNIIIYGNTLCGIILIIMGVNVLIIHKIN